MPVQTRSQTRSGQSPDLVTSSTVHQNPGRMLNSRQAINAGVVVHVDEGGPSIQTAKREVSDTDFAISNCNDKRCKTCPSFIKSNIFISHVTGQEYNIINNTGENLTCHSQNIIYLLTCQHCGIQYIGETILPFHKRNNLHRTEPNQHIEFHIDTSCPNYWFSYQIIEKLPGNGYNEDGSIDEAMSQIRKDKEDVWIKKMRVLFPYGFSEKARDKNNNCSIIHKAVGKSYKGYPITRRGSRPTRNRENRNNKSSNITCNDFFTNLDSILQMDLLHSFYRIRVLLDQAKKKTLKEIAFRIHNRSEIHLHEKRQQWYLYILDIIDTKLLQVEPEVPKKKVPENICTIKFINKGMDLINLSELLRQQDVLQSLPENLQDESRQPQVVMKLESPIRHKIMNYEDTVRSIKHLQDEDISFTINSYSNSLFPCFCSESTFCDPHHKHIVTGDLRFITNVKLRKLFSKGPNFREKKTINFRKCIQEIEISITTCAIDLAKKYNLENSAFDGWLSIIKEKVASKVRNLKKTVKPQQAKPTLKDEEVVRYLSELHKNYVIVPIDKASNNIAIICKRFYVMRLLKEVGALGIPDPTYQISDKRLMDIVTQNIELCEKYGLKLDEKQKTLPIMYWMPKMHYTPSRARFIMSSAKCSTKPISNVVSNAFRLIFNQIQNFHQKSKFYKNYNRFWVINNSKPLIDKLNVINTRKKAKEISTFDFSTLYTKLPHEDLIEVLNYHIDFVFKGGPKKYLGFCGNSVFWKKSKSGKSTLSRNDLKFLVRYLITNTYCIVGNLMIRQSIGIPMGIDPAPFWANLYLHRYEEIFISSQMSVNKVRARKFIHATRFIDDECNLNDCGEFSRSYKEIYPKELELKCEHQGTHATFLDIDITIVDGLFIYKLFDKRDDFPFSIVRMPDLTGNIPDHVFYGSIMSEFLRIARCTLKLSDFIPRAQILLKRMLTQGGSEMMLLRQIRKAMSRHPEPFEKFATGPIEIINKIIE